MRRWNPLFPLVLVLLFVIGVTASFASHPLQQADGDRLHWRDNDPGFPRGYMYWQDTTGAAWPVFSSAIEWDRASRLDAVYTSGSCSNSHCVTVRTSALAAGCSAPYGVTAIPSGPEGHFTTDVNVQLDAQCSSRNAADRRELVCHELGHSIGLDDRAASAVTCMRTGNMIGRQVPDGHDFEALANSYNHNDPG
jgi:hypothetical protein